MKKLLIFIFLFAWITCFPQGQNITKDTIKFKRPGGAYRGSIYRLTSNADQVMINSDTVPTEIGPVSGYKYPEFAYGIKQMYIVPLSTGSFYYISKIEAGVADGGNKRYKVEMSYAPLLVPGAVVCSKTITVASFKTTTENFILGPISNSGVFAEIVIDWSKFVQAKTYTCSTWKDGRIWAPATRNGTVIGGGGGGAADMSTIGIDSTINGISQVYIFKGSGKTATLDDVNWIGDCKIINMDGTDLMLSSATGPGTVLINGAGGVVLHQYEYCTVALVNLDATLQFIILDGIVHVP
jgi:hypothetical protein